MRSEKAQPELPAPIGEISVGKPLTAPTTLTDDAARRLTAVILRISSGPHTFTYDYTCIRHGLTAPDGSTDVLLLAPSSGAPLA